MPSVFIVTPYPDYVRMFREHGWDVVENSDEADLIQFTGGEDVHPTFYDEKKHPKSMCRVERDHYEMEFFDLYRRKPKAGICRGGQFLNVMSGGKMLQHVVGHTGEHKVVTRGGEELVVSSTHHQMMEPSPLATALAWAEEQALRKETMCKSGPVELHLESYPTDPEVLFYGHTNSLCFQPHPEFYGKEHPCTQLYFKYLKEMFNLEADNG